MAKIIDPNKLDRRGSDASNRYDEEVDDGEKTIPTMKKKQGQSGQGEIEGRARTLMAQEALPHEDVCG